MTRFDNHWSPEARRMMAGYVGLHVDQVETYWRWASKTGLHPHGPTTASLSCSAREDTP